MNRTLPSVAAVAAVCTSLLAPASSFASDAEIRQAVADGAAQINEQENKIAATGRRFSRSTSPSRAQLRRFRAAAREEEAVIRDIRQGLVGFTPDTKPVGRGRTLMAEGVASAATGLDRIEKALGRLARGGSAKAAARSITKAQRVIVRGNELIEQGEPLVGVELTPDAATPG